MLWTQPKTILHSKRGVIGIRTKHQIISEPTVSFGSHPYISLQFLFSSGKPLCAERGIAHFTLSSGTDQSYLIRNLILFDIAENISKINLNEF